MTLEELKSELKTQFAITLDEASEAVLNDKDMLFTEKVKYFTPKNAMPNLDDYIKISQLLARYEA